jgi:hypothetical protein
MYWISILALCVMACSEQQPPPQPAEAAPPPAPAEEQAQPTAIVDQDFINHMHTHADKMDELMFALADGDLDAAMTAANWLGEHQSPDGIRAEWQPYLTGMREATIAVELATNLETARTAAEQITAHCQACHAAAGVTTAN